MNALAGTPQGDRHNGIVLLNLSDANNRWNQDALAISRRERQERQATGSRWMAFFRLFRKFRYHVSPTEFWISLALFLGSIAVYFIIRRK
jgi:hypothetical protein